MAGFYRWIAFESIELYTYKSSYIERGSFISHKTLALALVAVILGFGVVVALTCTVKPVVADTALVAGKVVDGLRLTMAIQKTAFKTGELINITFTVTNIGTQTVGYTRSPPEFDFIVYNSSNSNLYQWTSNKIFIAIILVTFLDPGDSYTSILNWPQTCNQTAYNNEGVPISPGQYSIIGLFLHFKLQTSPLRVSVSTDKPVSMIVAMGVVGIGIMVPVVTLLAAVLTKKK